MENIKFETKEQFTFDDYNITFYVVRNGLHIYRPQRSCGKVMFLHLSVILLKGGVADTPRADTPWETPPCTVHAGRYRQQVGGMHPTGMQSCL